jgi:hypothetical protein
VALPLPRVPNATAPAPSVDPPQPPDRNRLEHEREGGGAPSQRKVKR